MKGWITLHDGHGSEFTLNVVQLMSYGIHQSGSSCVEMGGRCWKVRETPEEIAALIAKATEDSDVAFLRERASDATISRHAAEKARDEKHALWKAEVRRRQDEQDTSGRMERERDAALAKVGALTEELARAKVELATMGRECAELGEPWKAMIRRLAGALTEGTGFLAHKDHHRDLIAEARALAGDV